MSFARVLEAISRPQILAGMDRMQPDMRALVTELLARFDARDEAPRPIAQEGAALALWGVHWQTSHADGFLAWHRSIGGLPRALEVLLAALAFERRTYEWDSSIWALVRARPAIGLGKLGVKPWLWMRRALDEATPAERAASAEIASRVSQRSWHVRAALAFAFPDDDSRWTADDEAELRQADVDDHAAVTFGMLAAMRKASIDHGKLAQHAQIYAQGIEDEDDIPPSTIASTLGAAAAVAPLRLMRAYAALAALDHPDAVRALLELCDADASWEAIAKLPATAATIAALASMFTTHRPRRTLGLQLARGFLTELVTAAPDEAAKVAATDLSIARLLDDTGARLPADDTWMSPWAKPSKGKAKAKKPEVAPPAIPEDVAFDDKIHWRPGERENVADPRVATNAHDDEIEQQCLEQGRRGQAFVTHLRFMKDAVALRTWKAIETKRWYGQTDDLEHLVARFGLPALDSFVAFVVSNPDSLPALVRVESPRVAPVMARGFLSKKKTTARLAQAWLERFPEAATLGLLRDTDADKKQRDASAKALAHVASQHPQIVEAVVAGIGATVDVAALVAAGVPALPARAPKLPDFVELAKLPRPIRVDDAAALQGPALGEFVQLIAATLPGGQPTLDAVASRYTEESLALFAWSLFRQWLFAGAPPKHKWALHAVGRFPDDDNARALGRLARNWAPGGHSARAQEAVETLAAMQTQAGLLEIYDIAKKVQSKALRARAETVFAAVARSLGLGADELADRLVPELSEADLTFGDLRAEIDAQLVPKLVAADGSVADKPRDADDAKRWRELEKICKTVARTQLARLEQMMADGHRMPYAHFSEIYLMHSLIRNLSSAFVWGAYRDGKLERMFAIAGDGPVDVAGAPIELAIDDKYGVVHPVELAAADRAAWAKRMPSQPFEQLARAVFPVDNAAVVSLLLAGWIGRMVRTAGLLELQRGGWRRGESPQGGRYYTIERRGSGWSAEIGFTPGIYLGNPHEEPTQTLEAVAFFAEPTVPAAVLSEIQRDVRGLAYRAD